MKRTLMMLTTVLSLAVGVGAAQANQPGSSSGPEPSGTIVSGTIVSVNASAGTFVADAHVLTPPVMHPEDSVTQIDPMTTQVTITTNASTTFTVDGNKQATIGQLAANQRFYARFAGDPSLTLAAMVATPALAVYALTPPPQTAFVEGQIVSVDPSNGSFVANAFVLTGHSADEGGFFNGSAGHGDSGHGHGDGERSLSQAWEHGTPTAPTTTQVTINTNSNTKFSIGDTGDATFGGLVAGQRFIAQFAGSSTDPMATLLGTAALRVHAWSPRAIYAFVGSVSGVSATNGTVTVNVAESLPAGLVPAGSAPQTFTVGAGTLIFGGTGASLFGDTLANVSVGDVVAGGLISSSGLTLAQVESTPLNALIDFPVTSGTPSGTPSVASHAEAQHKALKRALDLLGVKSGAKSSARNRHHRSHGRRR